MNIIQAIQTRKSIRDFKPDLVSKTILAEILATASRAPSAENSQPWEFTVIAGDVLDAVKIRNIEKGIAYPEVLHELAGIPESKRIVISIAIGYPNWDFPANAVISRREPIENITRWIGFE